MSVLVVSFNSEDWLDSCLASIPDAARATPVEVIVVDNDSTDGSVSLVRTRFPEVRLLENGRNVGFAKAVNQAATAATGNWLLLLNPDGRLLGGTIDRLLAFAKAHPSNGIYGGRTYDLHGQPHPASCWALPSLWSMTCFAFGLSTILPRSRIFDPESMGRWERDSVREVGMITGCLLLVRREDWRRLDGFDERYFVYGEDADLAARARTLGMSPIITPVATMVHAIGASSVRADKRVMLLAGRTTFIRDHWTGMRRSAGLSLLRQGAAVRALLARRGSRGKDWTEAWQRRREWWHGFGGGQSGGASGSAADPDVDTVL